MTGPVCYVERAASGTLIRGVRVVGDRLDRAWSPPPLRDGEVADPAATIEQTRAAARWVAQQLPGKGARALSSVCLDIDGGLCLWLSAPSSDAAVVTAAMTQGRSIDDPGDGAGTAGLLSLASAGAGMERSVQALDGPAGAKADGRRRRMAVLSVPDLTVRVFLDELDAEGVDVGSVATFWHAMSSAWNPDRRAGEGISRGPREPSFEERIAANMSPCSAVIVLDPGPGGDEPGDGGSGGSGGGGGGRLVWSWAAGGDLLAGGAMRLRTLTTPDAPAPADGFTDGARRIEASKPSERTVVCGKAEVGRLVADWLAWSAQLGISPTRVICVGPLPATDDDGPGLVELLARGWSGASVDAAIHPDPVGATLERLGGPDDTSDAAADDARSALVGLSHRPGRAHRAMYRWGAAALVLAAGAIGILGWRLSAAAESARKTVAAMRDDLSASLVSVTPLAPNLATPIGQSDPVAVLRSALQSIKDSRPKLIEEEPILAELGRLLSAMDTPGASLDMKLEELLINSFSARATLILPAEDGLTGPIITANLQSIPGFIEWKGEGRGSAAAQTTRTWNLNGIWIDRAARNRITEAAAAEGRP